KTKKSVEEGLKKIYEELKTSLISCNSKLNCDSCKSKLYPCKCCVIQSIKEVKGCPCLQTPSNKPKCHCNGKEVSCNKVLAGLEACLHLQCLQADMNDICQCSDPEQCCQSGKCTQASGVSGGKSCDFCEKLQTQPTTGLGLSPPNPIRLAKRLETFFGNGRKPDCTCQCGSNPGQSCCCLACQKCSESCNDLCKSKGSQHSGTCPRKVFCLAIDSIKIPADSTERTCCESGKKCHCGLEGSNCQSGQCCVVTSGRNSYHSLKCLIRRLVKFFKDLESLSSSQSGCSKLCCELLCVLKISYFLKDLYNDSKSWAGKECSKCKPGGGSGKNQCNNSKAPSGSCCGGTISGCTASDCCQGCPECNAIKLGNALQTLQLSSPCGQDLYRVLDDFLYFCCNVFWPYVNRIQGTVKEARQSCQQCKSGTFPCNCSSSSSNCKACQEILKDSQLKVILLSQYVSSYDSSSAKWESLCKSGSPKCCGSPSPPCSCPQDCSSGSPSCPKDCCEKCPKRLCAKIFLGMLPCLYYALKYLYDKCNGKGGWSDLNISSDNSLGRFLVGMGYEIGKLDETKTGENISRLLSPLFNGSKFKDLYEKSKKYFTSRFTSLVFPSDSKTPSTVREILLWLSGLPFTPGFEALLKHCKGLCEPVKDSVQFNDFEASLFNSCFLLPISVLTAIERPGTSEVFPSEAPKFFYPSDPSDLLDMLFENVRKVFVPLKFLCLQCENGAAQGGWKNCAFGQTCAQALKSSSPSGSFTSPSGSCSSCPNSKTYLCTANSTPDVHDGHCLNGQCLGSGSSGSCTQGSGHKSKTACNPCPHPLLRFLLDGSSDPQPSVSKSLFQPPKDFPSMGFKSESLISPARSGESLFVILDTFVGKADSDEAHPVLRDLLRFLLCLTRTPPSTFGEIFSFYFKLAEWINPDRSDSRKTLKENFKTFLEAEISSHPGTYSGQKLTTAVYAVYGSDHPSGNHSAAPYSLRLLAHCWDKSHPNCGNFLCPLVLDAWDLFAPSNSDVYLSWLCYFAREFQTMFKDFHQKASTNFKNCCLQDSSGKCQKIVSCPCALPFLYKNGFTFMKASNLSGKKCSNFIAQLGKFVGNSTLDKLIAEIEAFLWSIREPFFLFVLAFWAFVISYFLYVQLYKLDLLHLKSHAHFSRSFKILP
ncbi:variant erythrocyte surface antigen-1 family protein, partial [Babesia divergens]